MSNGAIINLFGAATFTFVTGGSPLNDVAGTVRTFDLIATSVLSITVPTGPIVVDIATNINVAANGTTTLYQSS